MGTKVQVESYFPGYYSMPSENSNGITWSLCYGDKSLTNSHYSHNGFLPRAPEDGYLGCEMNLIKQKMLEQDAIFKSQVYELHRVYRIQRDLMDKLKGKELHTYHRLDESSSLSSSPLKSAMPSEKFLKCNFPSFSSVNSIDVRPPNSSAHLSSIMGQSTQADIIRSYQNRDNSKDCEILESRPEKVRRKMFDLQLPADEYMDTEQVKQVGKGKCLEDLNEPFKDEEATVSLKIESKRNGREWMPYMLDAGQHPQNNLTSTQRLQHEKFLIPSLPLQAAINQNHQPHYFLPNFQSKEEQWKKDNNNISPYITNPSSYQFAHSSVSTLEKPTSSLSQQSALSQARPCFLSSANLNSSQSNSGFGSEVVNLNGFSHRSSSGGYKSHLTSSVFDYQNYNGHSNAANKSINPTSSTQFFKGSNYRNLSSENHYKQDWIFSEKGLDSINGELKHNGLPWLQGKPTSKDESSSARDVGSKRIDSNDCPTVKKLFGVSIFENQDNCKDLFENDKQKTGLFDMNHPCNPEDSDTGEDIDTKVREKRGNKEFSISRHLIDLNSCLSEDEALTTPSNSCSDVKTTEVKDLKAQSEHESQELAAVAAEAIVEISSLKKDTQSSLEDGSMNRLHWFADVVLDDLFKGKHEDDCDSSCPDGVDYFEYMTLKLPELKIDEVYIPVQESSKFEEAGNNLLKNQPRKGPARRARQQRDFQRDILPGLNSLSRIEVREDLQAFEEIMRATGHSWNLGSKKRNGHGRGRRRSVNAPLTNPIHSPATHVEVGLDDRSLTGWGKTTRRPRRQRCPAGSLSSQPVT